MVYRDISARCCRGAFRTPRPSPITTERVVPIPHLPSATRHSSPRLHYLRVRCRRNRKEERQRDGMLAELMLLATPSAPSPSARRMLVDWWLLLWPKSRER